MMNKYLIKIFGIGLALMLLSFSSGSVDRIRLTMTSESLNKGKVVRLEAELFYQALDGKLVTRYIQPEGQLMISNDKGELSIYNNRDNTVFYRQGLEYSSQTNLIYFFLQGKVQDLGLRDLGFQQMNNEFRDGLTITQWFPPAQLYHLFNYIELVHEDFLPIYAAYYDPRKNLVKKVFYSDYQVYGDVVLPLRVTEFNYVGKDSIINRVQFRDVQINRSAQSPWFNYEIPSNAKIIK